MSPVCNTCGSQIASNSTGGLCAKCLFTTLASASDDAGKTTEDAASQGHSWQLPGFEIISEIARGGSGIVYQARQLLPARDVAIKVLLPFRSSSADFRERFQLEVETLARLDHPQILPIYTFGEHDGLPWFCMRLARGGTLTQKLENFAGDWNRIALLMAEVAEGVSHAHDRGVLHRDLKPGNLLFDEDDHVFIGDFGLARLIETASDITATAAALGTPAYMAPEVLSQGVANATVAADVWGLGAVLSELLNQRPPFSGATIAEVATKIQNEEPFTTGRAPRDLTAICLHALRKQPERRYASARAFAEDLRAWLAGRPLVARRYNAFERARIVSRKHPLAATLVGVAVLAAAAATLAGVRERRLRDAEALARTRAESAERDTREHLRESAMDEARAWLLTLEKGHRARALDAAARAASVRKGLDATSAGFAALQLHDLEQGRSFELSPGNDDKVFCSPDGKVLARIPAAEDSVLFRPLDAPLSAEKKGESEKDAGSEGWLVFSGDGRLAACHFTNGAVRIWNTTTGEPVLRLTGHPFPAPSGLVGFGRDIDFNSDGTRLIVSSAENGLDLFSLPEGRLLAHWEAPSKVHFAKFSPDGKRIAAGCARVRDGEGLFLLEAETLAVKAAHRTLEAEPVRGLAWSSNGTTLLEATEHSWHVRDGATGQQQYSIGGDIANIPWMSGFFANDTLVGGQVAVSSRFNLVTAREGKTLLKSEFGGNLSKDPMTFTSDGERLFTRVGPNQGALFKLQRPLGFQAFLPQYSWESAAAIGSTLSWSPQGDAIATFGLSTISLWDVRTGKRLSWIDLGMEADRSSGLFTADGKQLLVQRLNHGLFRLPLLRDADNTPHLGEMEKVREETFGYLQNSSAASAAVVSLFDRDDREQNGWIVSDSVSGAKRTEGASPYLGTVLLSPKGKEIAFTQIRPSPDSPKEAVVIRTLSEPTARTVLPGTTTEAAGTLWLNDIELYVFGTEDANGLWDTRTAKRLATFPDEIPTPFTSVAVSHDGAWLAVATGMQIHLLDARTLQPLVRLPQGAYGQFVRLEFSPADHRLAAQNYSDELFVWDLDQIREELGRHGLAW